MFDFKASPPRLLKEISATVPDFGALLVTDDYAWLYRPFFNVLLTGTGDRMSLLLPDCVT